MQEQLQHYLYLGAVFGGLLLDIFFVELAKPLHYVDFAHISKSWKYATVFILLLLILLCTWAMSLNPLWNGQIPEHRDQYERLADAFLSGHLYLDYGPVDPKLLNMENPYDTNARTALGVDYPWDHAWYNGHFYMYFGVVPVLLLFVPFKLLTGFSLTGYHATQVFTAGFFCGIFAIFYLLASRFFKEIRYGAWLLLTITVSLTSLLNCIACPALYNTAVSSALCMEIWSLYFFLRAVFFSEDIKRAIRQATMGSVFGALAFGCRPNIALANLLAIPLLIQFLQKYRGRKNLWMSISVAFLPYLIIGVLLMWYNYARFDNPFEFGQSFQLTVTDQSHYSFANIFHLNWVSITNALLFNFLQTPTVQYSFPFFSLGGLFIMFPIYNWIFVAFCDTQLLNSVRRERLTGLMILLVLLPILISLISIAWSPFLIDRYREDFIWLTGILCFLIIGFRMKHLQNPASCSRWVCRWSILTLVISFLITADQIITV